ncbi:uncharacterized protein ARMOST_00380 [Armillaria ostoyae]|uniref:Uncharacterized protein n=1 Tax=Armillaria ostoyae TaxID=47428 RepID=A0A284QKY3_ARMOS|nr:uncharacterized protein ARMOST_00380 [Armillaria ostoyae]
MGTNVSPDEWLSTGEYTHVVCVEIILQVWKHTRDQSTNTGLTEYMRTAETLLLEELPSRIITLTTPDRKALPLPSPDYLAIRAAFCRNAHMPGAVEYVREEEEIRVRVERMGHLAQDGSSTDIVTRYMAAAVQV